MSVAVDAEDVDSVADVLKVDGKLAAREGAVLELAASDIVEDKGVEAVSGLGLMIGIKTKKPAGDVVKKGIENGVLCLTAKDKGRCRIIPYESDRFAPFRCSSNVFDLENQSIRNPRTGLEHPILMIAVQPTRSRLKTNHIISARTRLPLHELPIVAANRELLS